MKAYMVTTHFNYGASLILGIYTSKKLAINEANKCDYGDCVYIKSLILDEEFDYLSDEIYVRINDEKC